MNYVHILPLLLTYYITSVFICLPAFLFSKYNPLTGRLPTTPFRAFRPVAVRLSSGGAITIGRAFLFPFCPFDYRNFWFPVNFDFINPHIITFARAKVIYLFHFTKQARFFKRLKIPSAIYIDL